MQLIALAAKKTKRPPVTILSNWKKRADGVMKRARGYTDDAMRDEIAQALQRAYADGRRAADRNR